MKRRFNRRRRQAREPVLRRVDLRRPLICASSLAATMLVVFLAIELLDQPIVAVDVQAPFQRVAQTQIERIVYRELRGGFLSADLDRLRVELEGLPWVDRARIQRRWPSRIAVAITEQVAAAVWGETGLLNTRGELFVERTRHVPPELPRLHGPAGSQQQIARLYLRLRGDLAAMGVQLHSLSLDARGAWRVELGGGTEIRLGRGSLEARLARFVDVALPLLINRWREVEYVDMRYSNGFAVGWNESARVAGAGERVPNA